MTPVDAASLYNGAYYRHLAEQVRQSVAAVVPEIITCFSPSTAIDLGCGDGQWTLALAKAGVRTTGVDFADVSRDSHPLATFVKRDLTDMRPGSLGKSDVCLCLEVAEHLPLAAADSIISLITSSADLVVFSAAIPGQGGTGHLNEQPHCFWIALFASHGFRADGTWRKRFHETADLAPWYRKNIVVFTRTAL